MEERKGDGREKSGKGRSADGWIEKMRRGEMKIDVL